MVAESAEEFARAAVELHDQAEHWTEARDFGWRALDQSFSVEVFERELLEGLTRARANRDARSGDWIRRMLTHHSLETPRFFGKWLELKEGIKAAKQEANHAEGH
jgi:hypothetical protein